VDLAALEQRARERRANHLQSQAASATSVEAPAETMQSQTKEKDVDMSDTKTETSAWGPLAAGVAGLLLGENGIFGGGRGNNGQSGAVTPDQMNNSLNQLAAGFQREQTQGMIAGLGAGNAIGFGTVKDAVTDAASANALALCGLSGTISQGFAATNFNIQDQASKGRELALQQALDAERSRATELRIQLSEAHNNAQHATTQVLLNQVIVGKGATAP